jgi:hypothetical protein
MRYLPEWHHHTILHENERAAGTARIKDRGLSFGSVQLGRSKPAKASGFETALTA